MLAYFNDNRILKHRYFRIKFAFEEHVLSICQDLGLIFPLRSCSMDNVDSAGGTKNSRTKD